MSNLGKEKSKAEQLQEELFLKPKHAMRGGLADAEIERADQFCEDYKVFLNSAKTEREAAGFFCRKAEALGFTPFNPQKKYHAGDKVYRLNREKAIILAVIGEKSVGEGVRIAAAHIDSPRLDLKPNPLYEDFEMALFKTHYYGGIKKYQWTAIPLSLHGVIIRRDGSKINVSIGEQPDEPKFVVTDLLPHLAQEQMKRTLADGVRGEELNILIGSRPFRSDEGSELVKLNIMKLLHEKYGIVESDFLSAELELVPAFPVCDIGFDRSMIGAYGQDDRVCAYAELRAILNLDGAPERTAVCILADKEETGSDGVSGMQSQAFEAFMADLCEQQDVALRHCFAKSFCLSADVCAAYDPSFPEVSAKRTEAKLNYGMGICKFTGARGKSGTSDASAELVAYLRRLFADNGVVWQLSEMGKVDQGGGGTIAKFMADRNIDTIDAGVPVLSMHAPFELVSKFDCWMTYRGVLAAYCDTQA